MPNPYNITEVNVPQLYGMAMQAQEGRIRNLLLRQQLQAAERQAEREQGIRQVIARAFAGGNGQPPSPPSPPSPPTQPRGMSDMAQLFGQPNAAAAPEAPAQPAQAPQAAPRLNMRELFGQLVSVGMDVREARETAQALAGADPQQLQMLQQRQQALASVLIGARRLPDPQARRAFIMQAAPQLAEFGIDANSIDPSDQYLDAQIALGTPIERALEAARPQLRNVGPGDVVIDVNNPSGPPVYESPFVMVNGAPYQRPPAMRTLPSVRTPEEASRLPPGTQFRLPDGRIGTVPGGPSATPTGNF